ncbi:MarR family transcriptional regulator [Cyanobacteria bacterium FACHB-63]|nr:MarR family transcriptional regulator [Cyanobacteria bacterium FACHB-63]
MGAKRSTRKKISEQCAVKVVEVVPLVMRCIRADMRTRKSTELSVPQFRSLAFLDRNPGASLSELAEHLGVTRATASANTERLVQRNYVHRCDNPEERRRVVLNLTEAGKQHLYQTRAQTRAYITDLFNNLTEEQVSCIDEALSLLKEIFEEPAINLPED